MGFFRKHVSAEHMPKALLKQNRPSWKRKICHKYYVFVTFSDNSCTYFFRFQPMERIKRDLYQHAPRQGTTDGKGM